MTEILPSVGIVDARTRLAELCGEVARSGQAVWLCRRGTPIVELRAVRSERHSDDGLSLTPSAGILDLWRDCRDRFGPVQAELPSPDWFDSMLSPPGS